MEGKMATSSSSALSLIFLILALLYAEPSKAYGTPSNTSTRREWLTRQTAIGGAIVAAAVANKISIRGPTPFQPAEKSLESKVIVITGGNTGLGFESAKRLAKAGATVIITSRSLDKGKKAIEKIQRACQEVNVSNPNLHALQLDLCSLKSVKEFPKIFKKEMGPNTKIDVLLNNAGVMAVPKLELTQDNFERTFQTNHLGHFALTALLFPMLSKDGARVINVSSGAHWISYRGLDLENLNGEKSYGPWTSYGASKLENILFTEELQKRVNASTGGIKNFKAFSLHPGAVRTDLARYLTGEDTFVSMMDSDSIPFTSYLSFKTLPLLFMTYFTKSVERGATTQIWLASGQGDEVLKGGEYLFNCKVTKTAAAASDSDKAKQLWEVSEKMSGVTFKI